MESFIIEGGHRLSGTIAPQGAKNEALEVICATLLTSEEVIIRNVPDILDVNNLIKLLQDIADINNKRQVVVGRELTKLHEEILSGSVSDILHTLQERQSIKGEFSVFISGKA